MGIFLFLRLRTSRVEVSGWRILIGGLVFIERSSGVGFTLFAALPKSSNPKLVSIVGPVPLSKAEVENWCASRFVKL